MFFFSWEARNGGIILTREPEIMIVTYMYVPWAPRHICCDVYIRPVGFKGIDPFMISLDKRNGSCNVLSSKICLPKKNQIKMNLKKMTIYISRDCKCKFNSTTCNSNQKCNNETCQCKCKNYLILHMYL